MKKRELVKKIAEVGCARLQGRYDVRCDSCPLVCTCTGTEGSIKAANEYLIAHPKGDKPCPHCGGSGEELTTVTTPGGSTAFTKRPCPLCLGTGKRIKRAELEAEVVRLREGK
jgi:DnaJ-class molecular chaperone